MVQFSDNIIKQAWQRSEGKCECLRVIHDHGMGRCNKELVWENRGKEEEGGWEAHCSSKICDDNALWNIEIHCLECHTLSL